MPNALLQLAHGHGPVDMGAYARVLGVVVLPAVLFVRAASAAAKPSFESTHTAR